MEKIKSVETMIISDLHLGSEVSRASDLLVLLSQYSFERLVLLGDIFDDLDFRDLGQSHWDFLAYIGDLSKKIEVVWVEGNHDKGFSRIMSALVGGKVHRAYSWMYRGEKCLAIHGHQFDRFLINNALISFIASELYILIQRLDGQDQRVSRFIKNKSKSWLRLSEKVARSAILYGKLRQAKHVFCGHTHRSMEMQKGGVNYYNSGCWTDKPASYITLSEGGIVVHQYS